MLKLQFKNNPAKSFWLVDEKVTLGLSPENDVVLAGLGIANFHAEIQVNQDQLTLKAESGSCMVNNLPVDNGHQLKPNDELKIGNERLLIIDPKQQHSTLQQDDAGQPPTQQQNKKATGWSLSPLHPELKDRDFSLSEHCILGRGKHCDVLIPYKLLSREHAQFIAQNGEMLLKDLNSSNGTFVNGQRIQEAKLHDGDTVSFAKLSFVVEGPAGETVDINKTMMRPAVNLEQVRAETGAQIIVKDADDASEPRDAATTAQPAPSNRLGLALLAVLLLAGLAVWLAAA